MTKNIGYVNLSDGRKVCVEAEHNGPVKVTLIYPVTPAGARIMDWASLAPVCIPEEAWADDVRSGAWPSGK